VLSRSTHGLTALVNFHDTIEELAAYSSVPVINGLTDRSHPSQAIADLLTIKETFGGFSDVNVTWVGDGNNVASSFAIGASIMGIDLTVASPPAYQLDDDVLATAAECGAPPRITDDPVEGVSDADVVYTDVWVSMGNEEEEEERRQAFEGFQVNESLLSNAPEALVMHCLPAHRGEEITSEVLDGQRSLVWDQAENRLHAQNGLLVNLLA
jgi:ornithine carbamoyltransferase